MFGQGLSEVGPGEELLGILVVGRGFPVHHLIKGYCELVGVEGAALADFLSRGYNSIPRVHGVLASGLSLAESVFEPS